jgi:hypothetical protein
MIFGVIPSDNFLMILQTISILLLPIIIFIILLINIWKYKFKNKKENFISIIIHGLVIFFFIIEFLKS